ncbi:hypothetical protein PILCRDRAFT_813787 [Piloderma croceum F 1598]|uniref:F5/8 type C domain-containing protein n=1 Tax=Piloderma croceum (strain F 1598) TaxID=765440 RepID=A0A0C3GAN6_PILCF|nr:hypothetical protein PILCRDRAFT_813787 [Piloderma croceum F 1598]
MSALESLITSETKIKVSSTLDKSSGKKYLVDGSPETCWTSQQGIPQHIQLGFPSPVVPRRIVLTFQGGFVGTRCSVDVRANKNAGDNMEWHTLTHIYPEDVNRQQSFELKPDGVAQRWAENGVENIKLVFEESSDFFGRITVYDLKVEGSLL